MFPIIRQVLNTHTALKIPKRMLYKDYIDAPPVCASTILYISSKLS